MGESEALPVLEFKDLSDEQYREYVFPNGSVVRINNPKGLNVKAPPAGTIGGGSHRVLDEAGLSHYIPAGWVHLSWKVKEGRSPFAF